MRSLLGLPMAIVPALALAHEGHGMGAHHWHATDVLGFVALGAVVAVALWLARRK